MRDVDGAADGGGSMAAWVAEIADLEGRLAMARTRLIARLVRKELAGEDPSLIDQSMSDLGRNKHIEAVRRRMAAVPPQPGAFKRGRRYLLTQEAYAEELGLQGRPDVAKASAPPPDDAESRMLERLERLRGRR